MHVWMVGRDGTGGQGALGGRGTAVTAMSCQGGTIGGTRVCVLWLLIVVEEARQLAVAVQTGQRVRKPRPLRGSEDGTKKRRRRHMHGICQHDERAANTGVTGTKKSTRRAQYRLDTAEATGAQFKPKS